MVLLKISDHCLQDNSLREFAGNKVSFICKRITPSPNTTKLDPESSWRPWWNALMWMHGKTQKTWHVLEHFFFFQEWFQKKKHFALFNWEKSWYSKLFFTFLPDFSNTNLGWLRFVQWNFIIIVPFTIYGQFQGVLFGIYYFILLFICKSWVNLRRVTIDKQKRKEVREKTPYFSHTVSVEQFFFFLFFQLNSFSLWS